MLMIHIYFSLNLKKRFNIEEDYLVHQSFCMRDEVEDDVQPLHNYSNRWYSNSTLEGND